MKLITDIPELQCQQFWSCTSSHFIEDLLYLKPLKTNCKYYPQFNWSDIILQGNNESYTLTLLLLNINTKREDKKYRQNW